MKIKWKSSSECLIKTDKNQQKEILKLFYVIKMGPCKYMIGLQTKNNVKLY